MSVIGGRSPYVRPPSIYSYASGRKPLISTTVSDERQFGHGDLHGQTLMVNGDDFAIIDWMDATRGNPLLDACRTYMIYAEVDAGFAVMYLKEFCRQSGVDGDAVMRLARMSEKVGDQ